MLLQEVKPDGAVVNYIYLNGKQIAKVERKNGVDKKFFYHTDHLGSTRAITDEQGAVVGRFEYQPFGLEESITTGDDTLAFTGKMQDEPTGLMYFNARNYDPMLGRFITEDSFKDGVNWYIYCENSPINNIDPNGKASKNMVDIFGIGFCERVNKNEYIFSSPTYNFLNGAICIDDVGPYPVPNEFQGSVSARIQMTDNSYKIQVWDSFDTNIGYSTLDVIYSRKINITYKMGGYTSPLELTTTIDLPMVETGYRSGLGTPAVIVVPKNQIPYKIQMIYSMHLANDFLWGYREASIIMYIPSLERGFEPL